jgi:hypothetical protein
MKFADICLDDQLPNAKVSAVTSKPIISLDRVIVGATLKNHRISPQPSRTDSAI